MNIGIDQSGKIENASVPTIIAFSNHAAKTILINASDKRHLQQLFREGGKPKLFSYKLFAILVFILLKDHLSELQHIIIDTEYPGWDHLIKERWGKYRFLVSPEAGKGEIWVESFEGLNN